MKLTKEQKDSVYDEIFQMFMTTIPSIRECDELTNLIIDDVVEDIETTADWSDYDDDEYNLSDTSIAIYRTLKTRLEK